MKSTFTKTKTIVIVLILGILSLTSISQETRFSISINSLTTNFNYGKSNQGLRPYKKDFKGFQAGVSYQVRVTPAFSVVPELYFAIKGGILKQNNPVTINKSILRFSSIEIPVLVRFHFKKLYLNAGPYSGYAVGGRLKIDGTETIPHSSTKISFSKSTDDFKRWDAGIQAGAGYNFSMKKSTLTLDVRYGYGLVNMSRELAHYNRMLNISLVVSKRGRS